MDAGALKLLILQSKGFLERLPVMATITGTKGAAGEVREAEGRLVGEDARAGRRNP